MRFGIQPFEWSTLVNIVSEDGSFDMSRLSIPSIVKRCITEGYKVIELGLDMGYVLPGSINEKTIEDLDRIKKANPITYTVHLPLWSIEPASPNEFIRKASVEVLADSVRLCEPLEPEVYVIHATGALAAEFSMLEVGDFYREFISNQMANIAEKSLQELLSKTNLEPAKLAIETVIFPFKSMKKIIANHGISVCLDTGHVLAGYAGKYTILGFLEEYFDRVIDIHLHDGYREEKGDGTRIIRDHLPLGEGKLPITDFFDFLERNGYTHPLVFELTLQQARQSLTKIDGCYPKALRHPSPI